MSIFLYTISAYYYAVVVKLVYTHALGACAARHEGSSPSDRTMCNHLTKDEVTQMMCDIEDAVRGGIPGAEVSVVDPRGNGHHFEVIVASDQFAGRSQVEQHRMVYATLKNLLAGDLHSVVVRTSSKQ